jgi:UDP-N-acetyl-2-amino-2-deoxyglucuronate dehydrogenase
LRSNGNANDPLHYQFSVISYHLSLKLMSSTPRFAIVGCGKIAPRHATEACRHGELVAVCDIIQDRANEFAERYHCRPYYRVEEMLSAEKDITVSVICTPNGLHAIHSILSLRSGAHVLCEKPLCIHVTDAHKMMDAANAAGKKLFVVKSTRYNPALARLKELISSNKLGKLYSFQLNCFWNRPAAYYQDTWKGKTDMDGGTLYTQFSHYIDALLWIMGEMEEVSGFRDNLAHKNIIGFEDSGVVSMRMKNGMLGGLNWSVNTPDRNMEVSLTVLAEKGTIRIAGEYMNHVDYQYPADLGMNIPDTGSANDYGTYKGSMSNHDKVYENLVLALNDESHPFTYAGDGLRTVETIEKIYKAVPLPFTK